MENIRLKRIFDIGTSSMLLIFFPFLFFYYKRPISALKSILKVFIGLSTWVGYHENTSYEKLPKLKNNILSVSDGIVPINPETCAKLNVVYAKDYSIFADLRIVIRNLRHIG